MELRNSFTGFLDANKDGNVNLQDFKQNPWPFVLLGGFVVFVIMMIKYRKKVKQMSFASRMAMRRAYRRTRARGRRYYRGYRRRYTAYRRRKTYRRR